MLPCGAAIDGREDCSSLQGSEASGRHPAVHRVDELDIGECGRDIPQARGHHGPRVTAIGGVDEPGSSPEGVHPRCPSGEGVDHFDAHGIHVAAAHMMLDCPRRAAVPRHGYGPHIEDACHRATDDAVVLIEEGNRPERGCVRKRLACGIGHALRAPRQATVVGVHYGAVGGAALADDPAARRAHEVDALQVEGRARGGAHWLPRLPPVESMQDGTAISDCPAVLVVDKAHAVEFVRRT